LATLVPTNTDFHQQGRQILYFKLRVDGHKFDYRRPQVVHRWSTVYTKCKEIGKAGRRLSLSTGSALIRK